MVEMLGSTSQGYIRQVRRAPDSAINKVTTPKRGISPPLTHVFRPFIGGYNPISPPCLSLVFGAHLVGNGYFGCGLAWFKTKGSRNLTPLGNQKVQTFVWKQSSHILNAYLYYFKRKLLLLPEVSQRCQKMSSIERTVNIYRLKSDFFRFSCFASFVLMASDWWVETQPFILESRNSTETHQPSLKSTQNKSAWPSLLIRKSSKARSFPFEKGSSEFSLYPIGSMAHGISTY